VPTRRPNSIPRPPKPSYTTTQRPRTTTPADSPSFVHDTENDEEFDWDKFNPKQGPNNRRPNQQDLRTTTTPRNSPSFMHDTEGDEEFDWDRLTPGRKGKN
jgi:hypothetical protein